MQWSGRTKFSNSFSFSLFRNGQVALCSLIFVAVFWVEADAGSSGDSSSCDASSSGRRLADRRLGSGASWYCHEYERDHLEAAAAAVMLVLAMAFESVYHYFLHLAEHSFVYGQSMLSDEEKKAAVHRGVFGKPLRLILFSRMGGEFMVLGFLAFTIWTCNQQELFDAIARISPADIHTPSVASDILHLMEEVHMQLFVAMILYFAIVFRVVICSDHKIQDFENCRAVWIKQLIDGEGGEDDSSCLRAFKLWRGHFAKGCVPVILAWREGSHRKIFRDIMTSLKVEKEFDELTFEDLQDSFSARFSFCTYLVFSLGSSVLEIVNVTHETWITIIFIKAFYAFLHRVGKIPLSQIAPFFCLIAFVLILLLFIVTHLFIQSLCYEQVQSVRGLSWLPGLVRTMSKYCNPLEIILTAVQVLLFFLCHSWAGYMISKSFWEGAFKYGDADKVIESFMYPLVLCLLTLMLPKCVPDFAIVMSLPPFFSHKNEKVLQLVCVQVVDKEMVRARAAVKKRMDGSETNEVKTRLRSIYQGTPSEKVKVHHAADDATEEADNNDMIIQPFLSHVPVMQAQHVHKEPKTKKKVKVPCKSGSNDGKTPTNAKKVDITDSEEVKKAESQTEIKKAESAASMSSLKSPSKNALGKPAEESFNSPRPPSPRPPPPGED